jgi:hypothetical protein
MTSTAKRPLLAFVTLWPLVAVALGGCASQSTVDLKTADLLRSEVPPQGKAYTCISDVIFGTAVQISTPLIPWTWALIT